MRKEVTSFSPAQAPSLQPPWAESLSCDQARSREKKGPSLPLPDPYAAEGALGDSVWGTLSTPRTASFLAFGPETLLLGGL